MDNCGGGGKRLPPDGDEFPTAYQEFKTNSSQQQYKYVTTRETMAANGDVDRGETTVVDDNTSTTTTTTTTSLFTSEKSTIITKSISVAESRSIFDKKNPNELVRNKDLTEKRTGSISNFVLYGTIQKNNNDDEKDDDDEDDDNAPSNYLTKNSSDNTDCGLAPPPPLPSTGPPTNFIQGGKKFAQNGVNDLWRQDNKSEKSVKDKIAMFSSQCNLEAPLFPASSITGTTGPKQRLSKHKSSDDVFNDNDKRIVTTNTINSILTQSTFDLSPNHHDHLNYQNKTPSLPRTSPPSSPPSDYSSSSPIHLPKSPEIGSNSSKYSSTNGGSSCSSPLSSYSTAYSSPTPSHSKSFNTTSSSSIIGKSSALLTRATSFSGSSSPYGNDKLPITNDSLGNQQITSSSIARTGSLASTFKRPNDEMRKNSLNQLIEQRRKGISKLRGLVIPEKDAVCVDRPIIDLPEIKSRESILVNNQVNNNNRVNANNGISDKWGSQNSLVSNASTISFSVKTTNAAFKMPAPKILSNYSPAFKRKSLTNYNNNSQIINNSNNNNSTLINGNKTNTTTNQLSSPASEAPKSLESICSPTRSDYSFDFVSSSGGSPENNHPATKPKFNCQRKIGRNDYDDSDNDSAVSSSQSSLSRGFSPPTSPVPSDRSTMSSERSYLSSEIHYQRPQLIIDHRKNDTSDRMMFGTNGLLRSSLMTERSYSVPEKSSIVNKSSQQQYETNRSSSSQIPQRQMTSSSSSSLKRSISAETNTNDSTLALSTSSQTESLLSRRVLKPQSVEAINRKNILASARCRSGRDLNGSPLIQRKFVDDEKNVESFQRRDFIVDDQRTINDNVDCTKTEVKIAYIEVVTEEKKDAEQPRLPAKRGVISQIKNVPVPASRPPLISKVTEPSNDIKSWVRSEIRNLTINDSFENDKTNSDGLESLRKFKSKSTLALNEQSPLKIVESMNQSTNGETDLMDSIKLKSRSKKEITENDLLSVLMTKSRSRSGIHVEDDNYGKLKSQMSLEDILVSKSNNNNNNNESSIKLPRNSGTNHDRKFSTTDTWSEDKVFSSKIPSFSNKKLFNDDFVVEKDEKTSDLSKVNGNSKIPMSRNLGRRSASVTDMKKVFEKVDNNLPCVTTTSVIGKSVGSHNRFPSLDSSVEDSIRPVGGTNSNNVISNNSENEAERFNNEQFGSISSLASSTSLISQQELAQLVEEANLEEPKGGHDVAVVLLHKENPTGSVGIILAGGMDCETKEITIHRVLSHSIADKEGNVQRGDRILSINGRSMRGLTHRESLAVLKQPRSEVVLVVSRAKAEDNHKNVETLSRLRSRVDSSETILENCKTNDNTAWGPALIVNVFKDGTGLGFSLEGGHDSPLGDRPLLIKKIFTGGAAEKTGALQAGDQLLEVNNRDVSRMSRIEAWSLMKKLSDGEVSLLVRHPATN